MNFKNSSIVGTAAKISGIIISAIGAWGTFGSLIGFIGTPSVYYSLMQIMPYIVLLGIGIILTKYSRRLGPRKLQ